MIKDLFGAPECFGNTTSSGTESIILSVLAHREFYAKKKGIEFPEMIIPSTAQPAFRKAAKYLDVRLLEVSVDPKTHGVDLREVKRLITRNTFCLVGSLVNVPFGIEDDIEALSQLAL